MSGAGAPPITWIDLARALRTARGLTQEGWAAQLGVSDVTVRRWERGAAVPTAQAEADLVAWCRRVHAFRTYDNGPLHGLELTPVLLAEVLTAARLAPRPSRAAPEPAAALALVATARAASPPVLLPPARLIGRVEDRERLCGLLRGGAVRLVTLTGPGGAGKTRLALEVAARLQPEFAGVWVVRLESLRDADLVLPAIAAALGLVDDGARPLLEQVCDRIGTEPVLMVLDNMEQVLPAAAAVSALLAACPRLAIATTSRIPLHATGEVEVPVTPLPAADAAELFVERATAVRPDFSQAGAGAAQVAEICARLDGLPLAIELAAVWTKTLSLPDLRQRLLPALTRRASHPGDRPARHYTVQDTIAWSYDLLDTPEQALFRRLAVFAGGWSLAAAEAICAGDNVAVADVLPLLAQLVDQSLVVADLDGPEPRYRLLETIAAFAAARLEEAGEGDVLRGRHRAWCLALAEQQSAGQAAGLETLAREHDNLRAALTWQQGCAEEAETRLRLVAALWRYWQIRGHLVEGRRWLEDALTAGEDAPLPLRARVLNGLGSIAFYQGDMHGAERAYGEALAARRALGDRRGVVTALSNRAIAAFTLGRAAEAGGWWEEALTLAQALGDKRSAAQALGGLSLKAQDDLDHDRARALLEEAHVIWQEMGDTVWLGRSHGNIGAVAYFQSDDAAALRHCEEGLAIARRVGNQRAISVSLYYLGKLALRRGDHAAARRLHRECLEVLRTLGDRTFLTLVLEAFAELAAATGHPAPAARIFGATAALRELHGVHRFRYVEPAYTAAVATARAALSDEAAWDAAWAEGRAWSIDAVYAAALQV